MPMKRMSAEQIVVLLPQTKVQTGQDKSILATCGEARISDKPFNRYSKDRG